MSQEPKGQQLIKIEEKDHYFYDKKSGIIYFVKTGGIKFSTGIVFDQQSEKTKNSSLIKASRVAATKEKEKIAAKEKKKVRPLTNRLLGEYLDDMTDLKSHFHKTKKNPVTEETLEGYRTSVSHLKPFFESYLPDELTPDLQNLGDGFNDVVKDPWLAFVDHMQEKVPGYNMFNLTKHFRALTKYLHMNGLMRKRPHIFNPFSKKENVLRRKKSNFTFTPEHITLMDAVCDDDQRLALWLGYDQAFRQDDCVKLVWERINLSVKPYIEFHGDDNKAGFVGKIPLSDTCAELLRERRKTSTSKWVFPLKGDPERHMLSQVFEFHQVIRLSGVGRGSHKTLRHTRLTEDFANPNLDNAMVMKIRRVSLQVALEHYIHPTEDDFEKFRNTSTTKRKAA